MEAGKLRHLVTIIRDVVLSKDEYGQEVTVAEAFALIYASIRPLSEREIFQAREIHSDITHVIKMRRISGITAEMRILHEDRIFQFLGPPLDLNERHIEIEILARERTAKDAVAGDLNPTLPLAGLLGHYDPSITANVNNPTDDAAITLLSDDLSTFENDAFQSNPGNIPKYKLAIQNGLNISRHGIFNQFYRLGDGDDSDFEVDDFTIFFVGSRGTTNDETLISCQSNIQAASLSGFGLEILSDRLSVFMAIDANSWHRTVSSAIVASNRIFAARKSGTSVDLWVDGALEISVTNAPSAINFAGTRATSLGAQVEPAVSGGFQGDLWQVAIYGLALDDAQVSLVFNLLSNKWAIPFRRR